MTTTPVSQQISNLIAARTKSFQVSACDGEQLIIRCDDDLGIDVITAEYTIIPNVNSGLQDEISTKQQQQPATTSEQEKQLDTRVSQPHQPIESLAAPTRTGNDANSSANNSLCPPLPAANATNYSNNATSLVVCNELQAQKATEGANVSEIVKQACQTRNSCSIDMRTQQAQRQQQMETNNNNNNTRKSLVNFSIIQKLTNEVCTGNRKLLEVVYKCRPNRLIKRYNCRGEQMQIDCQPNKRIVLGNTRYGSFPSETKIHERCLREANTVNITTTTTTNQPTTNTTLSLASTNRTAQPRDCLLHDDRFQKQIIQMCLYKQHCRFDVQPQLIGQAHCPMGQPEYLIVIFVCLHQDLIVYPTAFLNSSAASSITPNQTISTIQKQNEPNQFTRQQQQQPFTSANVSSSSLLYSSSLDQNAGPTSISVAASVQSASSSSSSSATPQYTQLQQPGSGGGGIVSADIITDLINDPINYQQNSSIFTAVASDPNLLGKHPKFWSPSQKVGFLMARYQPQLLAFACFSLSMLFLALMVRGCQRLSKSSRCSRRSTGGSSTGSGSGKNSHSSCLSTSTISAGAQCHKHHHHNHHHHHNSGNNNCNSSTPATFAAAAGHNLTSAVATNLLLKHHQQQQQQQPAHLKHNSCSESCFSLEDYHIGGNNSASSNNHSPALDSIDGCANNMNPGNPIRQFGSSSSNSAIQQQHHQARPKLWSIYGVHNNNNNNNNIVSEQHQTMSFRNSSSGSSMSRPTNQRTFLGPPPPPLAPQLQLQLNQPEQQLTNQTRQQHNLASIQANELLLALAASNTANNQQAAVADNNNIGSWCATLQPQPQQQQQQQQLRAAAAMNSSDELQQHLQTYSSSSQQQQHCAFHQQQQQLYGVLPSPTALQLEPMATIGSNDLVMPINLQQQQFEQTQQFQSLLQVQQQQPGANLK